MCVFFFLILVSFSFSKTIPGLGVAFAPSDGKIDEYSVVRNAFENIYGKKVDFDKFGYHIFFQTLKSDSSKNFGDYFYSFIPVESEKIQIFCIPHIPVSAGPSDEKWRECNYRIIQRHADVVNLRCSATRQIPSELYRKLYLFMNEKKFSVYDGMGRAEGLQILFVDKFGVKTSFKMQPLEEFRDFFEPNIFVLEYVDLYNGFKNLIMTKFDECRWSNLGNARELKNECSEWAGSVFFDRKNARQVEIDAR